MVVSVGPQPGRNYSADDMWVTEWPRYTKQKRMGGVTEHMKPHRINEEVKPGVLSFFTWICEKMCSSPERSL